jgi:hypothetical protein
LHGEILPPKLIPFELGGVVWLDAHINAASGPTRGATISLAYGMLGACPLAWGPGATRVRGCLDVEVGAARAFGYLFAVNSGQEQPFALGEVAGRVSHRVIGPLDLGFTLGVIVPFNRVRYYYVDAANEQQELFRMSPVVGVVEVGLGAAFP